jgi:hypothetical protein
LSRWAFGAVQTVDRKGDDFVSNETAAHSRECATDAGAQSARQIVEVTLLAAPRANQEDPNLVGHINTFGTADDTKP